MIVLTSPQAIPLGRSSRPAFIERMKDECRTLIKEGTDTPGILVRARGQITRISCTVLGTEIWFGTSVRPASAPPKPEPSVLIEHEAL